MTDEQIAQDQGQLAALRQINIELEKRLEQCEAVCNEIQRIMATYREQEASAYGVGTPGGLEHMGDVWRLLAKWDAMLAARAALEAK